MKNIHVLPTNKPSLLFVDNDDKKLRLYKAPNSKYADNIYITNDEEIKEGDYGLGFALGIKGVGRGHYVFKQDGTNIGKLNAICNESKKIILTTDQDLIKEGVQAIDDEFLEWFVKNPTCEYVEVPKYPLAFDSGFFESVNYHFYKIIIPKEEPKQETLEEAKKKAWDNYEYVEGNLYSTSFKNGFEQGAKSDAAKEYWFNKFQEQDKNKYSEDEVLEQLNILMSLPSSTLDKFTDDNGNITMKWFEQIKKK